VCLLKKGKGESGLEGGKVKTGLEIVPRITKRGSKKEGSNFLPTKLGGKETVPTKVANFIEKG